MKYKYEESEKNGSMLDDSNKVVGKTLMDLKSELMKVKETEDGASFLQHARDDLKVKLDAVQTAADLPELEKFYIENLHKIKDGPNSDQCTEQGEMVGGIELHKNLYSLWNMAMDIPLSMETYEFDKKRIKGKALQELLSKINECVEVLHKLQLKMGSCSLSLFPSDCEETKKLQDEYSDLRWNQLPRLKEKLLTECFSEEEVEEAKKEETGKAMIRAKEIKKEMMMRRRRYTSNSTVIQDQVLDLADTIPEEYNDIDPNITLTETLQQPQDLYKTLELKSTDGKNEAAETSEQDPNPANMTSAQNHGSLNSQSASKGHNPA